MKSAYKIIVVCLLSLSLLNCNNEEKKTKKSTKTYTKVKAKDPLTASVNRGSVIYNDFCITCHMSSGEGVANVFPPLAKSDYLKNKRTESIKAIKYGLNGQITVNGKKYNGAMLALGLDDEEIADVMNFINHSWGNSYGEIVTEKEVAKIEK